MTKKINEPFFLTGITVRTSNDPGRADHDIPQLWNKFISENIAERITGEKDADIYCVYTEYEGDHTQAYTTLLGCKVKDSLSAPDHLTTIEVPAGLFQQFIAKGKISEGIVFKKWLDIWDTPLDRSYKADFEVYKTTAPSQGEDMVEIFVGIKG